MGGFPWATITEYVVVADGGVVDAAHATARATVGTLNAVNPDVT